MSIELTLLPRVAYQGTEITSARLRALLSLLATDLKTGRSAAGLVDGVWPDDRPENPTKALQILISRARSQLGSDVIETTPAGYRLGLDEQAVDSAAIRGYAAAAAHYARAGAHADALEQAEAGLALWDGTSNEAVEPDDPVAELRHEAAATYRSLVRARALALARTGRHAEALEPLISLFAGHPHDEELLLELLRSEAATAGASAALTRFEAYRSRLRDELGTDPGRALQDLHQELLRDTAPAVRQGMSHEPNALLGRDDDIAAIDELLHSSRVTSIVGPGGLGKTRLAHAVWRRSDQRVGYFVPLAGVTRDDDVIGEVAAVVGSGAGRSAEPEAPARHARDQRAEILSVLGQGPTLLVLDNCEQVVDGVAELVRSLVAATADLRVLATSRAPLGLTSESVYLLPELPMPTAVELFTQRARSARPDAELAPNAVVEVCRHLDGLPLAIELAAARVRVMSVDDIARGLGDRFGLLRGGARDTPERHRTLRAVIDWSWTLLDETSRQAMRVLSVLPGGFTAEGAAHVLGLPVGDVLDTLERLVEQSMLRVDDDESGTRFRMLETVREFSAAERGSAGEDDAADDGLRSWARHIGAAHYRGLFGPDPLTSIRTVRAEHDNLSHALRLALDRDDGPTTAATSALLGGLALGESNYPLLGRLAGDPAWLLSHYRPDPPDVEVARTALVFCAMFAYIFEGPRAVRAHVALRRLPPPEPETLGAAVTSLLNVIRDDDSALFELCGSDDPFVAGMANTIVSYHWEAHGDLEQALRAAHGILAAFADRGRPWLEAMAHTRVGELSFQTERPDDAVHHLEAGLPMFEQMGARTDAVGLRWWIVLATLQRGDIDEAERWARTVPALRAEPKLGTKGYEIAAQAEVQLAKGDIDEGLRLWRTCLDLVEGAPDELTEGIPITFDPWSIEARAVGVLAHAEHGRIDLVGEVLVELDERLVNLLSTPIENPPLYLMELQLAGTLLLALGAANVADGQTEAGVRSIALAERLGFLRNFQPTTSPTRLREFAQNANRPAYEDAASSYAGLDRDALRAAALTLAKLR